MIVVLLLAAGAGWEPAALRLLDQQRDVTVLKRCVDTDDLLASAGARQAAVAVVALEAPGLDRSAVELLLEHGVATVAIAQGDDDRRVDRAARLGVAHQLTHDRLADLPGAVRDAGNDPHQRRTLPAPVATPATENPDPHAPAVSARGRVLTVWGPAGAPGRSTLAAALAAEIARRDRRVLLVDADPHGGTIAQQLGILDEVSGLLAAARLAAGGQLVERLVTVQRALDTRLAVVTGLPRADRWPEVRPGVLEQLVDQAADDGDVVLDTGFCLEAEPDADLLPRATRHQLTLEALAAADEVLAVGTADPVGLARLARGLVELRETRPDAVVRVVVNRMRSSLGWSERDVAGMIAGFAPVTSFHFLPDDRSAVDRCLVAGRTLTEVGDTPLGRAVARLVDDL